MIGPGKYDPETTRVREQTNADCVMLVVFGGTRGSGFSVQGRPPLMAQLPALLRRIADEIDAEPPTKITPH